MSKSGKVFGRARRGVSVLVLGTVVATASGCSRRAPEAGEAAPPPPVTAANVATADKEMTRTAPPSSGAVATKTELSATSGRMVISEANLSLRANPDVAAESATHLVTFRGGYVASKETTRADDRTARVELVLRVPAQSLEAILSELRKSGELLSETQSGQDVTEDYGDTQAQLRAKRSLEERLLAIVASAKSVKEMLEVESELARVRTDIERLDGHARSLAGLVAFATIRLSLVAPAQPVVEEPETAWSKLGRSVAEARHVFVGVVAGIIVVLGALLPFAAIGGTAALAVRTVRRRKRAVSTANAV